jgi:hypothetical protein
MARGMWTGIAAGLKDIEETKRYEQEREEKLNLLNQERQDRLFNMALQFAPKFTASGVLTSGGGSGGGAGAPSTSFLEQQLKAYKFPEEKILSLQEKGPLAMQTAIEVYKDNYDPTNPFDEITVSSIADSILLEDVDSPNFDPKEYAKMMGLNMEAFPEEERVMREAILAGALRVPRQGPAVASTFLPTESIKAEDVQKYQGLIGDTLKAVLVQGSVEAPDEQKGRYTEALRNLDAGNVSFAVTLLQETGELMPAMKPLFDYYKPLNSPEVPLGVFEPIRRALSSPAEQAPAQDKRVQNVVRELQGSPDTWSENTKKIIEALRANKDDPQKLIEFQNLFGLNPQEYF